MLRHRWAARYRQKYVQITGTPQNEGRSFLGIEEEVLQWTNIFPQKIMDPGVGDDDSAGGVYRHVRSKLRRSMAGFWHNSTIQGLCPSGEP